jgi:2-carboxy-1,4-naphthoquinone phytyltransferase
MIGFSLLGWNLVCSMTIQSLKKTSTPQSRKLWLAAIKPPMYSVAIMPIWIGSAIAYFETKTFNSLIFGTFTLAAVLILAWENVTNDVFDSETGIDVNKAHSLVNLTRNKPLVFWIGNLCLALGIAGILAIALWQRDFTVLGLVLACCGLGYLYQGPPFRLGYHGLGEVLCFFAFGPLAVSAAYYSQAQTWSAVALAVSVILGLTTSLILFCSHFHQVEDDIAAGKRSPIVRLGTTQSARLLPWVCGAAFVLLLGGVIGGWFPIWTLLALVSVVYAVQLCLHVAQHHNQPDRVSNCKFIAVNFHFWSGLLLGIGFLV